MPPRLPKRPSAPTPKPAQALGGGGLAAAGPYRRFLLGLTGVTLAGVLALAGALNLLLHRYLVDSTAKVTQEAVVLHLNRVFPQFLSPHALHAPNPYGGGWDPDRLHALVRLHLDL